MNDCRAKLLTRPEGVAGIIRYLEWTHVGREAEEADCFKKAARFGFILDDEAPLLEQCKLRRDVDCRLAEWPHTKRPGIKNPLNLCIAAGAAIGMAGVLLESLCDA